MDLTDSQNIQPVTIWKAANIGLGDDRFMMVVYYYRSEKSDKSKSFYKCNIRIDTKENWMKMRDGLLKDNPAQTFTTRMIGMEDDYSVIRSKRVLNKVDFYRWLGSRFSENKIRTLDSFLNEEFTPLKKEPYLRKYLVDNQLVDISEIEKIPEGRWFSATREKKPRKKYGNIVL
jgi:hypothetical protein